MKRKVSAERINNSNDKSISESDYYTCPICGFSEKRKSFLSHLKKEHAKEWDKWVKNFVKMYEKGVSVDKIGKKYSISWRIVDREIKRYLEGNGKTVNLRLKPIKKWEPEDDRIECTTVWSFPRRGNWATHDNTYRGNWAPQVARNLILRYSKEGDIILDQMCGGGTTLIEAKLLGRKGIGLDINPNAIEMSKQRTAFSRLSTFEPEIKVGDARELDLEDNSIDLIATHPPYAGIIKYSSGIRDDISNLRIGEYIKAMGDIAKESLRVLKPNKYCAILVGDTRQNKRMVPIGFSIMQKFLDIGFLLKEIIIKEQHGMRATGFWYNKSIENNFLLIAHEYLFIFQKPG